MHAVKEQVATPALRPGAGVTSWASIWDLCGQGARDNAGSGAVHSSGLEGEQLHAGPISMQNLSSSLAIDFPRWVAHISFYSILCIQWHAEHLY